MPALFAEADHESGICELLTALPFQLAAQSQDDRSFLITIFGKNSMYSLFKIHEKLQRFENSSPKPVLQTAEILISDLADDLQSTTLNGDMKELVKLLSKPHIKSLLSAHDTVAQKNYEPQLPPLPNDLDDEEDSVKIVRLVKNKEPLGATIKRDAHTGAIIVARIMKGGPADRSGLIHVGDELKEVNGIPVDVKSPEEIILILAQCQGAITFKIVPGSKEQPSKDPKIFLRALFDYDPVEDNAIPCKEAAMSFRKGGILEVMSQDDPTWWQARHYLDVNPRAGLIPSKNFQERRLSLRRPVVPTPLQEIPSRSLGLKRSFHVSWRDRKTNKAMYECKRSDQYDTADVPTYEEVVLYRRPQGARHRLVVLVGPTGVGLNELKRKLLVSDPQHYGVTVPHTSRPKRIQETEGVQYHFISQHLFETDILNNKFIEYGEYKGNYYGTNMDSVRSVLSKNKVCLLDIQPQMIKHLRTAEFKPFVVFVKPPPIEVLRETRKNTNDKGSNKAFTEEEFQEMISSACIMENQYGHFFEKVIINDDLTAASNELRTALKKLEISAHWVPVSWTHA